MFYCMVGLLRGSKMTGFMRSVKLLENYLTLRTARTFRSMVVDSFAEDYFETTVYEIITSLEAETKCFENVTGILNTLEADLSEIENQNNRWFSFI